MMPPSPTLAEQTDSTAGSFAESLPLELVVSEALARCEYLIENGGRFGLLLGKQNSGKSEIFRAIAKQACRHDRVVSLLSLRKVGPHDFLYRLATELGAKPTLRLRSIASGDHNKSLSTEHLDAAYLWSRIEDRLVANALEQRTTVLLLDDLDHAAAGTLDHIARLVTSLHKSVRRLTLLGSADRAHAASFPNRLLDSISLRIDLDS